jgi:hypothetical protein
LLGDGHLTGRANRKKREPSDQLQFNHIRVHLESAISRPSFVLYDFSVEINTPKAAANPISSIKLLPLFASCATLAPLIVIRSAESDFLLFVSMEATNEGEKFGFRRGGAQSEAVATPGCMPNDELFDAATFLFSFGRFFSIFAKFFFFFSGFGGSLNELRGWSSGWKEEVCTRVCR